MKFKQPQSPEQAGVRESRQHHLMKKSTAELNAWLDANINDIASVRSVLALILKNQRVILRRLSRE